MLLCCTVLLLLSSAPAGAQVSVAKEKPKTLKNDPVPRSQTQAAPQPDPDQQDSPKPSSRPRTNEESSSRDTIIDLSPPRNDNKRPVDMGSDNDSDVTEMKPWNPHKAAKSLEVGEYYFKQKNYKAAISRYREALEYKPRDAEATFRLAEVLERTEQYQEARQRYEEYLQILKNGPHAEECRKGLERVKAKLAS